MVLRDRLRLALEWRYDDFAATSGERRIGVSGTGVRAEDFDKVVPFVMKQAEEVWREWVS